MFTSIRVGKENFIVIPEREYKAWLKKGFSADITGARPLTKSEVEKISSEMNNDISKGVNSVRLRQISAKWKKEL